MKYTLLIAAVLSAGCASPSVRFESTRAWMENPQLRIEFRAGAAQISLRRGEEWLPVARLVGLDWMMEPSVVGETELHMVTSRGSVRFRLFGSQLWFETQRNLAVEVLGQRVAALFPGLEFLEGDESSSSERDAHGALADRRQPPPWQLTVPLMAYATDSALVALMWREGGQPYFEAREFNRMALMPERGSLSVRGLLHVEEGATILEAVPRWTQIFGLPPPTRWPRSLEEELALCKIGLQTVAETDGRHRHCVGPEWKPEWTPGFGVLLHLLGEKINWEKYPDLLSSANCHILRWEAPFYAAKPELVKNILPAMKQLAAARVNGEWSFQPDPKNEKQAALGPRGATVLGTSAHNALLLAKAARMTGDPELRQAALETLKVLRKYRVPRGAQTWECPIYAPDLLAAAYALGANVEAFKISADRSYLVEAVRWAKAGLPFLYLWSRPNNPMMLYASIPIFGATFHTHPWFGVPVQWNGLVYAYYLRKLAPLDKSFDWLRVADGITASALHQQYAHGPSQGCYPDALYEELSRRSPPDLNPENILVNILTMIGKDPDPDFQLSPQEAK